jgi:SAM-dependent methyltransferase
MTTATVASAWPATVGDSCGQFFGTALRACDPPLRPDARVLEIGCCEYDWLRTATDLWPEMTFTGIDWRRYKRAIRGTVIQGDVMVHPFEPASCDWIVSISALEHVGLGHYQQDPKATDGDMVALRNCYDWLAPGGWLYFDVPYNPARYEVVGTSHRIYDDAAIVDRLVQGRPWRQAWSGVVAKDATSRLIRTPPPLAGGESFYYIGFWWQKPGA